MREQQMLRMLKDYPSSKATIHRIDQRVAAIHEEYSMVDLPERARYAAEARPLLRMLKARRQECQRRVDAVDTFLDAVPDDLMREALSRRYVNTETSNFT